MAEGLDMTTTGGDRGEMNHVEKLALAWAERDALESWMLAAPDSRPISPAALREVVLDYLAAHDPFPASTSVEAVDHSGSGWAPAVVIDRPGTDEWTVEFGDGEQAWRGHDEIRPHP